ncbi:dicarboxylate/amino acid:cation symporter [Corticimicrobacter populi]|uniref:Dicarboxylate/amino acid:cation symporter n=1 Tax=Corticimicrobacter populi TaxID=2175229 RepID=A0A2V1JW37_9BURK|nr:dicarboxylate/amino acid:cation symporter [Corticimicrobacter populi]PWF22545.1 dicarboxylate/amino acid:cation symporter [Corticimicrobacter populi]QDQ86452.1 dicarboxylate/amino acid:cation symporter [Alcaligenaceae bacterium SJ-26]
MAQSKFKINRQTGWILFAMVLGIVVGYVCNKLAGSHEEAVAISGYFAMLTDIFLRMIKMIIAPLIFATLVSGMSGMGDGGAVGRIGGKAVGWFLMASFVSLLVGLLLANVLQPGANVGVPLPEVGSSAGVNATSLNLREFITHVFPKNFFEAMSKNEVLQILVFAVFFGLALGKMRNSHARTLADSIDGTVPVMLIVTNYVMFFAPFGVFGAVANVITTEGLGILMVYGKFIGSFVLALVVLWMLLVGAGFMVLGKDVFRLIREIRQPMLLGFSTASSEAAYPRVMEALEKFGVRKRVVGFVLPLGYSFNLDGSMIYTTFVALFISQAYGIPLSMEQQFLMLLVLMVSSKGIAGVPRASLVVVAAVLPMFGLPEAGLLLIMGVDHFLDMGRTATNVLGNAIATAVVAKWEGALDADGGEDMQEIEEVDAALASTQPSPGAAA